MTTNEPELPGDFTTDEKTKGNGRIRIVLLLAIAAFVIYWIYTGQPENGSPDSQKNSTTEIAPIVRTPAKNEVTPSVLPASPDTVADADADVATTDGSESKATTESLANLPAGEAARTLIATARDSAEGADYNQLYRQAEAFGQQGKHTDAFLLYFFSAREGHGDSAMKLGEMNDPALFNGEGDLLEKADPGQAHKWYLRAAQEGVTSAKERLETLRETTEAAAAEGDIQAQRLLLNWK